MNGGGTIAYDFSVNIVRASHPGFDSQCWQNKDNKMEI